MTKAAELAKMGEVLTNSQIGGRRNIIINGAMQVAQRGTSSTSSGYSTVDRFRSDINNGTVTHSQETLSSGSPYDDGFRSFFRLTNTTSSSATSHRRRFYQEIEAQNIAKSGWNYTSSSSFITVSFWVRTSVAGDYYFGLRSFDGTSQGYVWEETLSANTWTKVTKSVSGNTNVQIDNDNNAGLAVIFYQSNGTDFTGGSSLDVWHTYDNAQRTPDDTNGWGGTTGATYDVTGIQLEVGEKATPFEHRSYGEELALCQRYFSKYTGSGSYMAFPFTGFAGSSSAGEMVGPLPATMRVSPTASVNGGSNFRILMQAADQNTTAVSIDFTSLNACRLSITASGMTTGQAIGLINKANTLAEITFDSEL